jgi:hypothetical protein
MSIPDAADPGFIWERAFDLYVAAEMDPMVESPVVTMWHGCGSDPEKCQYAINLPLLVIHGPILKDCVCA